MAMDLEEEFVWEWSRHCCGEQTKLNHHGRRAEVGKGGMDRRNVERNVPG